MSKTKSQSPRTAVKSTQIKSIGNFKIALGAVVCSEAQLTGDITIGSQTVVHPTVKIIAEGGPVIIGSNNLIMERTVIINKKREGESVPMVIGDGNVFECGCHCESLSVGDENTFEARSFIGENIVVTERCVIGANCSLLSKETLPPGTVITGNDHLRWTRQATTQASNLQQIEYLVKLLPNFHRLTKPTVS